VVRKQFICITIFIFFSRLTFGQSPSEEALLLYKSNQYTQALKAYQKLLSTYPNDPEYNYYAALSIFELKTNWDQCLEYLLKVSSNESPDEYHYYLGRTYLYLLAPKKALLHLNLYEGTRSLLNLKVSDLAHWQAAAAKLEISLTSVPAIHLLSLDTVAGPGYTYINRQNLTSGRWNSKEDIFFINAGVEPEQKIIFQPSPLGATSGCIFFSGKKGLLKSHANIFRFCEVQNNLNSQVDELPQGINSGKFPILFPTDTRVVYDNWI